ncbi:GeoRSP system SPASM domain protein [Desulfuromonas versatilis]|uniref:GeoRSP system SPASM domain protein n=1 Tax=Desulfuromonas versatilis TaxID=2802975 RepID=A0ABM8HXB0_9BACT|nr:SPASM domain-containing protein [Desulfuromonas versatilis]BCR05338.1 GeoRSP system SPASM domain protein [Desulfuromonas versatilis]
MDLLDTPLRVTWELHGTRESTPAEEPLRIAERLCAAGVFFVTLEERPLAHPRIHEILQVLSHGGVRILLVFTGSAAEVAGLVPGLPLDALLLDAGAILSGNGENFSDLARVVEQARENGYQPALQMTPHRGNLHLLLPLLEFGRDLGVGRIKLPNTRIGDRFSPSAAAGIPGPDELEKLRRLLGPDPENHRRGVNLEVHDLFIWELLFPRGEQGGRSEYGGCQAANSLGHVDAEGHLLPCSSWPEKLGSLHQHSLEELWSSPKRLQIRQEIAEVPQGCRGCRDYPLCLGGCRGLARFFNREAGYRDLMCREPRSD